jgi:hypothetical protein
MEILGKIFNSGDRVKIMRLFLLNKEDGFETKEIILRSRVNGSTTRKELKLLESIGFIEQRTVKIENEKYNPKKLKRKPLKGKKKKARSIASQPKFKKTTKWFLKFDFPLLKPMKGLLVDADFIEQDEIISKFKNAGKIKLLVVSGVFIKENDSRVDILIIGDNLKRANIEQAIRGFESEIGKQLNYAVFDTPEFTYRLSMYDKLIRDVLDYPHLKVIDKIGVLNTGFN